MEFRSKYCNEGKVVKTPQYLAELMCEREARQKNVELPDRFWQKDKWNTIFRRHITQCNRLLKMFSEEAVVKAFQDERTQDFTSFGNPRYKTIIREHEKKLEAQRKQPLETTIIDESEGNEQRKPMGKKSVITILKELDGRQSD